MFPPRLLWVAQPPGTVQAAGVLVQKVEVLVKTAFLLAHSSFVLLPGCAVKGAKVGPA
jgi:hypothetical protein